MILFLTKEDLINPNQPIYKLSLDDFDINYSHLVVASSIIFIDESTKITHSLR